jgi:S-adenosylmethionine decarboxylase
MHFGEHLMIDGYGGSYEKLNDQSFVLSCLQELPEKLGMRKLADPEVYFAEGNDKKDPGGWSGFVVIMESHISVHTFPARGFVSIDVYTCQNNIDRDRIVGYFSDKFDLSDTEVNFVVRGTKYPAENVTE